jgi:hypothetical protein
MKKFVNIYGRECDFYCPYCKDRGLYHCCLELNWCYCSCEAGKTLEKIDLKDKEVVDNLIAELEK